MAIVIQAAFNTTDTTTGLPLTEVGGKAWSYSHPFGDSATAWGILSNQAYKPGAETNGVAHLDAGVSDNIMLSLDLAGGGTARNEGVVFRYASRASYFVATKNTTGIMVRQHMGTGDYTDLATFGNVPAGTASKISVKLTGSTIEVFENDVSVGTLTNTANLTATRHGMYMNNATLTADNFVVDTTTTSATTYTQTVGQASVTASGAITMRLTLSKSVGQATMTPSGSLSQVLGTGLSVGGAILQPIGSLVKRTHKGVGGVVTSAGNAAKGMFKTVGSGIVNASSAVGSILNPIQPTSAGRTVINWVMKGLKNFFD